MFKYSEERELYLLNIEGSAERKQRLVLVNNFNGYVLLNEQGTFLDFIFIKDKKFCYKNALFYEQVYKNLIQRIFERQPDTLQQLELCIPADWIAYEVKAIKGSDIFSYDRYLITHTGDIIVVADHVWLTTIKVTHFNTIAKRGVGWAYIHRHNMFYCADGYFWTQIIKKVSPVLMDYVEQIRKGG